MTGKSRIIIIGRAQQCDLVLADDSVSRRHAQLILLDDGTVKITDLGSTHGTFVIRRGKPTPISSGLVQTGDVLRFGEAEITLADLLEGVQEKTAAAGNADKLVRCACGAIKIKAGFCPECRQ